MNTAKHFLAPRGDAPLFESARPTGQIHTPSFESFMARVEKILDGKRYSNGGPFQEELEARLAQWHEVGHVVAFGNACFALIALMRHLARPDAAHIVLPSFSYRGLPHFIQWAGKTPLFCDVDEQTHGLTADLVRPHVMRGDVAAILSVNNVTGPADLVGLDALSAETGVPVIHDSVYAIAAAWRGAPFGRAGAAEVFSLHATKLLNGFEGGYVTTDDAELAAAMRRYRNFGYDPRTLRIPDVGMNGKLNEIHAAMALASLDEVDAALAHNRAVIAAYREVLREAPCLAMVDPAPGMVSNDEMALLEVAEAHPIGRDGLLVLLQAERAMARPYFSPPLHRSKNCPPEAQGADLPISDRLAQRFIQLPTGAFVSPEDAVLISEFLLAIGEDVAA